MNVQSGGGVAAVIYNNVSGNFLGTLGDGVTSNIPAISLSQEDGQYLVANELGASGTVASTYEAPASSYAAWDGTSMATPHVSGVAALVWSQNTAWTNAQIRDALTATATDLGTAGRDDLYGYGLAQAQAAIDYLSGTGNLAPDADFTFSCTDLTCSFSDTSSDSDGTVVAWSWSFGDRGNSTEQSPSHTYAASGTYTVTLTVTDDQGASDNVSAEVSAGTEPTADIALTVTVGSPSGRRYPVTLTWSGVTRTNVDVYRNSSLYQTTTNDGTQTYNLRSGTYAFQVCEAGTSVCSDEVATSF
jgi:PKD repeat protein